MLFAKVVCTECPHYHTCSFRTKMLINYCGSQDKLLKNEIREAMSVCRSRRTYIVRRRRTRLPLVNPAQPAHS